MRTQQLLGKIVIQQAQIDVLKKIVFDKLSVTEEEYKGYCNNIFGDTPEKQQAYSLKVLKEISELPIVD